MTSLNRLVALRKVAQIALGCIFASQAGAQGSTGNPDLAIPVTQDNTCEFSHAVGTEAVFGSGFNAMNLEQWTNLMLSQAATHCVNGSSLTVGQAKTTGMWPHDLYQIAALLCDRPDIKETAGTEGKLSFRCTVTKLDKIKVKLFRGEQPFSWKTDRVPPRPDDLGEQDRRAAESRRSQEGTSKSARPAPKPAVDPNDCSVPANTNTNRCRSLLLPRGF